MQVYMPCEGDDWDGASDGGERPSGDHRRGPDGQCRVHMLIWSSRSNTLTIKRCPAYPLMLASHVWTVFSFRFLLTIQLNYGKL